MCEDTATEQERKDFLWEYARLIEKHHVIVTSCNCCDSPYMEGEESANKRADHILHLGQ